MNEKYAFLDSVQTSIKTLRQSLNKLYALPVIDMMVYTKAAELCYSGIDTMVDDLTEQYNKFFASFTNREKWEYISRKSSTLNKVKNMNKRFRSQLFDVLSFEEVYTIARRGTDSLREHKPERGAWLPMTMGVQECICDDWVQSLDLLNEKCILHCQDTTVKLFDSREIEPFLMTASFKKSLSIVALQLMVKHFGMED